MSWQAVLYVRGLRGLTVTEKAVAYALASRMDEGGAWPSLRTLAADAGCDPSTAWRVVRQLGRKGIVAMREQFAAAGDHEANCYWFPALGVSAARIDPIAERNGVSVERRHGVGSVQTRVSAERKGGVCSVQNKTKRKQKGETTSEIDARARARTHTASESLEDDEEAADARARAEDRATLAGYEQYDVIP